MTILYIILSVIGAAFLIALYAVTRLYLCLNREDEDEP